MTVSEFEAVVAQVRRARQEFAADPDVEHDYNGCAIDVHHHYHDTRHDDLEWNPYAAT